jgi:hypothetical protein
MRGSLPLVMLLSFTSLSQGAFISIRGIIGRGMGVLMGA